ECAAIIVPVETLNRHARTLNTDDIVRIDFFTAPRGSCGASLYHQQGVSQNFVSRRALADSTDVQMTRQNEVDAMIRELGHRHPRTPENAVATVYIRDVEGMMGDDDPSHAWPGFRQPRTRTVGLISIDAPVFESQ